MKQTTRSRARLGAMAAIFVVVIAGSAISVLPGDDASAGLAVSPTLESAQTAVPTVVFEDAQPAFAADAKTPTPMPAAQPAVRTAPRPSAAAPTPSKPKPASTRPSASTTDELTEARRILAGLIAKHPILKGTTVTFGDAKGHQAICYYKSGRIVISPTHTASLSRILNHEVWHIIDWRDNGRIDWGENVPPR